MPGRFFLGVGTGENLNEHILGDRWPFPDERRMLEERRGAGKPSSRDAGDASSRRAGA